jgi:hypothetical protein
MRSELLVDMKTHETTTRRYSCVSENRDIETFENVAITTESSRRNESSEVAWQVPRLDHVVQNRVVKTISCALTEANPGVLYVARTVDPERAHGSIRSPSKGISMLIKDNIVSNRCTQSSRFTLFPRQGCYAMQMSLPS